ncbi:uncharacterized protein LOC105394416 [Plutella xylostella]|uniref:uncharacterized protein LOC105394416 n=1 Tax=Plutella xylostella TaxID=51655 RepID=UPI002032CCBC|nr:uncharacterized protein LOC105394416 [Plutella xylostella]
MWRASYYNEDWERRKTYLLRSYFEDIPKLENSNSQCESEIEIVSQKSITDEETNESINTAVESNNDTLEENNNYHSEAENAKNIITNSNKSIGSSEKTISNEEICKGDIVDNKSSQSPTFTEIMQRRSSSSDSKHEVLTMQVQAEVHAENEPGDFCPRSNMILRYDDSNNNRRTSNSTDLSDPSNKQSSRASILGDLEMNDQGNDLQESSDDEIVLKYTDETINEKDSTQETESSKQISVSDGVIDDEVDDLMKIDENSSVKEITTGERLSSCEISQDSYCIENEIETMRAHTPIPERRGSIITVNASGVSETEENASFREHLKNRRTFSLPQNDEIEEELQRIDNEDELDPLESNANVMNGYFT